MHIQVQELSNKAAARYDKANSQHTAAKEMIRMSESQLSSVSIDEQDPSSPSSIDQAWQEMLNHATTKVNSLSLSLSLSHTHVHVHIYHLFIEHVHVFVTTLQVMFTQCKLVSSGVLYTAVLYDITPALRFLFAFNSS